MQAVSIHSILDELLEKQQSHLSFFYKHLDLQKANLFFETCLNTPGALILTGVGKSGFIAEKIAMTLISTGTKAHYLPPINFLHGDIGMVTAEDSVIMLSKSGESEELLNLIPFLRKRGAKLLSLVCQKQNRIAAFSDLFLELPLQQELCPFDLAPTTSTELQLLFGDLLTIALMRSKEFNLDQYAQNHPLGNIGRKITLSVADVMKTGADIPLCFPDQKLVEVLVDLSNKRCGCLLIVDKNQKLLGIFTDGDLRRFLQLKGSTVLDEKMMQLMTTSPITVSKEILAFEALKMMQKDPQKWVMITPVVEDEKVVGILRMHDIVEKGITS